MKTPKEIETQLKNLETAYKKEDINYSHYTAYRYALNWVLEYEYE